MATTRVTQLVAEAAQQGASSAQSSQLALEVSVPFIGTAVPLGALSSQLVVEVSVAFIEISGGGAGTPPAGTTAQEGLTGGAVRLVGLVGGLEAAEGVAA